jgi:hypothetical protein
VYGYAACCFVGQLQHVAVCGSYGANLRPSLRVAASLSLAYVAEILPDETSLRLTGSLLFAEIFLLFLSKTFCARALTSSSVTSSSPMTAS